MRMIGLAGLYCLALCGPASATPADELASADRAFSQLSYAQGSNAAFLATVAEDVRIFGSGSQPPIYGKAAMVERFKQSGNGDPSTNHLTWAPAHAEVSPDGRVGVTDGQWRFDGVDGKGGKIAATGHYLTVWRHEADGWRVIADMGTTDPKPGL